MNHTLTSRWIGWLTLSGLPLLAFPPPPPKHFIHGIPRVFSRLSVASCSRLRFLSLLFSPTILSSQLVPRPPSANPSRLSARTRVARSLHLADSSSSSSRENFLTFFKFTRSQNADYIILKLDANNTFRPRGRILLTDMNEFQTSQFPFVRSRCFVNKTNTPLPDHATPSSP